VTDADEKPETIGELHDRLPPGEWREAYGFRWKRCDDGQEQDRPDACESGGDSR
jgi:hypothetical protein